MRVRYIPWQWFFVFMIMFLSILSLAVIAYSSHTAHKLLEQEVNKHNRSLVFFLHTELKLDFQSWIEGSIDQLQEVLNQSSDWLQVGRKARQIQGIQDIYFLDSVSNQAISVYKESAFAWDVNPQARKWHHQLPYLLSNTSYRKINLSRLSWNWKQNLSTEQTQIYLSKSPQGELQPYGILPLVTRQRPKPSLILVQFDSSFYRKLIGVLAKRYTGVVLEISGWKTPLYITDSAVKERIDKDRLKNLHSIGPFSLSRRLQRIQIRAYYPPSWDKLGGPAYDSRYSQYFLAKSKQFGELIVAPLTFLLLGLVLLYWKMRTSQRKIRIQNDWIENLAHDLQTPVHALGTVVEVLSENPDNEPYCRLMSMELQRMRQNARVFMQLAREGASQKQAGNQPFPLFPTIQRAVEMTRLAHRGKEPVFQIEKPNGEPNILGDRDAVLDALINILDNSCKYSPEQPQIKIVIEMNKEFLSIRLKDEGYGLPSYEFQRAFQPFYRALNDKTEGIQGNGLGLAIVQKVMENHQGVAKIEANEPKGTVIVLKFPIQRVQEA